MKNVNTQGDNANEMKTMTINLEFSLMTVKANINSKSGRRPWNHEKIILKNLADAMLVCSCNVKWCCSAARLNREADDDAAD